MDSTSHPVTSAHRCTSETCRYTLVPKNATKNSSTRIMALSRPRHDQRNSEEKRTCATQLRRPIDTSRLKLSQRSSQRHWPLPAPLGYICRLTPSNVAETGIGSSATIAACFQLSSCSLSASGKSRLHGLCCPS